MLSIGPSISTGLEMLWRRNVKRGLACRCWRLTGLPVMKLSRQTTSCPSARKRSHRCEPMKPAPPVMRVRMGCSLPRLAFAWRHANAKRNHDHCKNAEYDCRSARPKYADMKGFSPFSVKEVHSHG